MKIICIDDEPLILNMTVALCRELPAKPEVNGFSNAKDALNWLESHTADVALLDINMPDMNGLALAAKIQQLHPVKSLLVGTMATTNLMPHKPLQLLTTTLQDSLMKAKQQNTQFLFMMVPTY